MLGSRGKDDGILETTVYLSAALDAMKGDEEQEINESILRLFRPGGQ